MFDSVFLPSCVTHDSMLFLPLEGAQLLSIYFITFFECASTYPTDFDTIYKVKCRGETKMKTTSKEH